jgi:hypothetical protein
MRAMAMDDARQVSPITRRGPCPRSTKPIPAPRLAPLAPGPVEGSGDLADSELAVARLRCADLPYSLNQIVYAPGLANADLPM